jgi:hypothetical protein
MTRTRRRFAIWACILGAATLAVGIGVAAGAKLKTRSASTTVGPDSQASATAVCERGTRTISGGFELVPPESAALFPTASVGATPRSGGVEPLPRRWMSAVVNLGEDPASLTSHAYCRDLSELDETGWSRSSLGLEPSQEKRLREQCGDVGGQAVSGSFKTPLAENRSVLVRGSHRVGKHVWVVIMKAVGTGVAGVSATGYCRDDKVRETTETKVASGGDVDRAVARCKRGQRVISGGFETEHFAGEGGPFVYASRKQGRRGWIVRVVATEPEEFTAYAYCEQKK